uniref:Aspartyl protease n=1 Tax=Mirabilis jalapa TaxID=3538 RepID=B8YIB7_MIRJA|nr:aspartyl protease [Mirabilis jalapa]
MAVTPTFFLCFFLFVAFVSLSSAQVQQKLMLPLSHSLSKTKFTSTHHLLKSTTIKSTARHHHHRTRHSNKLKNHHRHHQHQQQISLPLSPGTDYTLTFSINSQTLSVYMDTGSDIVWFPCSPFECILCEGKFEPGTLTPLNVSKSSLISCKSRACSTAHNSPSTSDLCAIAKCPLDEIETSDCSNYHCPSFYYAYGDGSLIAKLHKHNLIMPSTSNKPFSLKDFTFGCAHSALGEPIGVAGFGFGSLSLPAQLANLSPDLGNQFSYCLVSHSFDSTKLHHPSPLILGKVKERDFDEITQFVYTPMLDNPKHPYFYSVSMEAISVGSSRVRAPNALIRIDRDGNGGVVVDSGTTYTMLPTGFYNSVATELDRRVGRVFKRASETESKTGLSPCYYLEGNGVERLGLVVPRLAFHFGGNYSVVLPRRNYFYEFLDGEDEKKGRKVGCLMLMDGGDESEGGPGATLGNYQQQGFQVVYDLEERRVGFAPRKCASLWESLTQG